MFSFAMAAVLISFRLGIPFCLLLPVQRRQFRVLFFGGGSNSYTIFFHHCRRRCRRRRSSSSSFFIARFCFALSSS